MEINLHQLPIPDWDVSCPQCAYPLRGLPTHRCPECGLGFDMHSVVKSWTRLRAPRFMGEERPLPDFGRTCGECQSTLVGADPHVCPTCRRPFSTREWRPTEGWFEATSTIGGGIPLQAMESLLLSEQVPHLIREGETTFGIDRRRLMVLSEFFFEFLWLMEREGQRHTARAASGEQETRSCAQCETDNPTNFEICWHCGAALPQ